MAAFNVFLIVYFFFQLRLNTEHFEGKNWPRTFIFYQNLLQTCLKHKNLKTVWRKKHGRSLWKSSLTALLPAPLSVKTATQTWPSSVVNGQDNSISEISPYYQGRWFYQHWLGVNDSCFITSWATFQNQLHTPSIKCLIRFFELLWPIDYVIIKEKKKKSKEFGTITQPF